MLIHKAKPLIRDKAVRSLLLQPAQHTTRISTFKSFVISMTLKSFPHNRVLEISQGRSEWQRENNYLWEVLLGSFVGAQVPRKIPLGCNPCSNGLFGPPAPFFCRNLQSRKWGSSLEKKRTRKLWALHGNGKCDVTVSSMIPSNSSINNSSHVTT